MAVITGRHSEIDSFEILQSIFILSFNWLNLKLWKDDQDKPTLCNWEKKFMEVGKLIGCI